MFHFKPKSKIGVGNPLRCGTLLAACVLGFLVWGTWLPQVADGEITASASLQQPAEKNQRLVFTTFPSVGMGTLFARVLTEAYAEIGYAVEIQQVPPERALVMADLGNVDGEAARVSVIEPQCSNLIRVPTPVYTNTIVGLCKREGVDSALGWDVLRSLRLGSVLGYKYIEKQTEDMDRLLLPTYDVMFKMLEQGRIDVALTDYVEALPKLKIRGMHVHQLDPPFARKPMYHYLHKKHKALVPKIDMILKRMIESGRLSEILLELEREFESYPAP